jgi:hypothetical protein
MAEEPVERLLTEFTLSRDVALEWTAIGTAAGLVSLFGFGAIYAAGTGRTTVGVEGISGGEALVGGLLALVLVAAVVVVHEAIHAAVVRLYGEEVSFGVGVAEFVLPYAYVTTTRRLTRNQFVAVALAPLVVISVVGTPLMIALDAPVLMLPLAFNAAGAVGDLWMAGLLFRYPAHVLVVDAETGLRVYGRADDRPVAPTGVRAFAVRTLLGTAVGFGLLLLGLMFAPILLSELGVRSFTLGVGDSLWSVFHFERTPDGGFESTLSPVGILACSVLVGLVTALLTTTRRRPAAERAAVSAVGAVADGDSVPDDDPIADEDTGTDGPETVR